MESQANNLQMVVNIRRNEAGNGGTAGFPRKEFVFSSACSLFLDLLFFSQKTVYSSVQLSSAQF